MHTGNATPTWRADIFIKLSTRILDRFVKVLCQILCVAPPTNIVHLPNHVLVLIMDNILAGQDPKPMDKPRVLKNLRVNCHGLYEPMSELLYQEGHLFLHPESLSQILHFSASVRKLVLWLPVFVVPGPEHKS